MKTIIGHCNYSVNFPPIFVILQRSEYFSALLAASL